MDDLLLNTTQSEEVCVWVDTCLKRYYLYNPSEHLVSFLDETTMPVLYNDALPYLPIRIPTKDEVHNCRRLQLGINSF